MKTSKNRPGEFLLSEGAGQISREKIEIAATAVELVPGTLLMLPDGESEYVPYVDGAGDEDTPENVASAILYGGVSPWDEPQRAVAIVRLAEVVDSRLVGLTPTALAQLEQQFIIVRN